MSKIFIDEIFSKKHYHVIYKAHLYIVYLYELTSTLVWIQLRIHLSRWWTDGGRLSEKHRGAKRHNGRPLLLHQYKYAICDRCLLLLRMLCYVCSTRDIFFCLTPILTPTSSCSRWVWCRINFFASWFFFLSHNWSSGFPLLYKRFHLHRNNVCRGFSDVKKTNLEKHN